MKDQDQVLFFMFGSILLSDQGIVGEEAVVALTKAMTEFEAYKSQVYDDTTVKMTMERYSRACN